MTDADERAPSAAVVLTVIGGAVLAVAGVRASSWLLAPCLLGVVIVVLTRPAYRALRRRGCPDLVAVAVTFAAGLGVVLGIAAIVAYASVHLTLTVRSHRGELEQLVRSVQRMLVDAGLTGDQSEAFTELVSPRQLLQWSAAIAPPLVSVGTTAVFFLGFLLFLTVESTQVEERFAGVRARRPALVRSLRDATRLIRRYFAVTAVFAVVVGALDTVFLAAVGIPDPVLWGVLAAACNFIPYVGFVIGLVPPALLALLDGEPGLALTIAVVYVVLNSLVTTLLPAKVVGDVVGLAMSATVVSLVFWAWALGPLGAVLAVPCTLLVKAVFIDADPRARHLAPLLNSRAKNRGSARFSG